MLDNNLIIICLIAFAMVFVLLSVLAVVMRLIMVLFPFSESEVKPELPITTGAGGAGMMDAALVAVISTATAAAFPGAKITKLEEIK